jgi:hypothetical protein
MGPLFALLTIIVVFILGVAGIFASLKMLQNFRPGRDRIQKDLQKIKAELRPWVKDLVPWSKEEMEQLSHNRINSSVQKGVANTAKGIITTIYHEPIIAYFYKKYVSAKENALLYARTSNHEFIYRLKNSNVELVIDNELVGTISNEGVLHHYKSQKPLAAINTIGKNKLLPVTVHGKEVGSLVNPELARKSNRRAFELLTNMGKEEEALFLSLSILEMVRRTA